MRCNSYGSLCGPKQHCIKQRSRSCRKKRIFGGRNPQFVAMPPIAYYRPYCYYYYYYRRRRLASGGIVTLGVTLSRRVCVCVCVSAEPLISHIDCRLHCRIYATVKTIQFVLCIALCSIILDILCLRIFLRISENDIKNCL